MKKSYLQKIGILILGYIGFFAFLFNTNPQNIAIGWLILPFLWLFLLLLFTALLAIGAVSRSRTISKKQWIMTLLIALIPTLLLLLNSVSQLTLADTVLIVGFSLLAIFYVNKVKVS